MKERTMGLRASLAILTNCGFIIVRMELKLLPAMRSLALSSVWTALVIISDVVLWVPVSALLCFIEIKVPFPSKILPIMGIHTGGAIVFWFIERTPDCLVVEQIEVHVLSIMVQKVYSNIHDVMSKSTEIPILTAHHRVHRIACRVGRTELGLIFIRMIELLNSVMSVGAVVTIGTLLSCSNYLA